MHVTAGPRIYYAETDSLNSVRNFTNASFQRLAASRGSSYSDRNCVISTSSRCSYTRVNSKLNGVIKFDNNVLLSKEEVTSITRFNHVIRILRVYF